ncbi:MAG: 16S rRNA (cytosine(1402)-N(4))-methyltransferase RsmH [Patescibacteria group bacterium]
MADYIHKSVLLKEMVESLEIQSGDTVVDCTLNSGGHSEYILEHHKKANVIGIDADSDAIKKAKVRLAKFGDRVQIFKSNFRNLDKVLDKAKMKEVDGFMFDLGWSSDQIEVSGRGFTFQKDEPLQMAYDSDEKEVTAETVVNEWSEETLRDILKGFGEEQFSGRIARAIVEAREVEPIKTTVQLREIVWNAVPGFTRNKKIHPATKTFQSIRIAVNDEFGALQEGLKKAFERVKVGRRIAVISFHSLEDRIVKHWAKGLVSEEKAILINKKPIIAGEEELKENPRARSAKLRIIQKTSN